MFTYMTFNKQRGLALLFTSIALLLIASTVTIYTTNSVATEQRVLTKNYQIEQALQAAEAGLDFGLAYLKQNSSSIVIDRGNSKIDGYTFPAGAITALPNGATYTIQYTTPVPANYRSLVLITATGISSDDTATRKVSQLVKQKPLIAAASNWPLTVQNTVTLSGNVNVVNNTLNSTIRSGGNTILSGSANTQGATTSSSSTNIRPDIVRNDSTLSSGDSFYNNYFGISRSSLLSMANIYLSSSTDVNYAATLNGQKNKIIWLEQTGGTITINNNAVIGSASQPVIMFVNLSNGASLNLNGGMRFYGLLYVVGNWDNGGGGTSYLYGNVIVQGNYASQGNQDVTYDPNLITNLGNFAIFTKVPGSWNDLGG